MELRKHRAWWWIARYRTKTSVPVVPKRRWKCVFACMQRLDAFVSETLSRVKWVFRRIARIQSAVLQPQRVENHHWDSGRPVFDIFARDFPPLQRVIRERRVPSLPNKLRDERAVLRRTDDALLSASRLPQGYRNVELHSDVRSRRSKMSLSM